MRRKKHKAYLLLGGNIGPVAETFEKAEKLLAPEVVVDQKSSLYKTPAWGMENAPDFLNQAWQIATVLSPHSLLRKLLWAEEQLGRKRHKVAGEYQSRTIDIDILLYEDLFINDADLKIPHPRMNERYFALKPLEEIGRDEIHPVSQASIGELLADCEKKKEAGVS